MTKTKPTVSYVLSRLSAQASYHHPSTRLGPKVILYQWALRLAPPSQPEGTPAATTARLVLLFIIAAAPRLWRRCGYHTEVRKVLCYSQWCWLAIAALSPPRVPLSQIMLAKLVSLLTRNNIKSLACCIGER